MADRTKIWIGKSMEALMKKKPIEQIHVTDICKEAGIERPTFYYYFKDKYDLVAWIFHHYASGTDVTDLASCAKNMRKMRENYLFFKRAFEDSSQVAQNPLWKYMYEYYLQEYTDVVKRKLGTDSLDEDLLFCLRYYSYGSLGVCTDWLLSADPCPPEEIVERLFSAMPERLKAVYFG